MKPVALVTGASVGLGRAFAIELARRGHDLVVVARTGSQLDELAELVQREHGARCEVRAADLTVAAELDSIAARLSSTSEPVDVLVNNAGFGSYGAFSELDIDTELRMIDLNVRALVRLTHAAMGPMVERGRGTVLNVSSLASFQPSPRIATYAGTKAFVTSFTQAVHEEVRGTGVTVTALCPGFTRTEFQNRSGAQSVELPGFVWQSPETVAQLTLDALARDPGVFIPGVFNKTSGYLSDVLPGALTRRIMSTLSGRYKH